MGLRVASDLKEAVDREAERHGRSQSRQAEILIQQALRDQQFMLEALEAIYGRGLAGMLLVIGEIMKSAGASSGFAATMRRESAENWWNDPYSFDQAQQGVNLALDAFRPAGEIKLPLAAHAKGASANLKSVYEHLGEGFARALLEEIAAEQPATDVAGERAPRLRRCLGDTLVGRIKSFLGGAS